MNKEKMLQLANVIENSNKDSFHMGSWFGLIGSTERYIKNHGYLTEEEVFEMIDDYNLDTDRFIVASLEPIQVISKSNIENGIMELSCGTSCCIAGWAIINEYYNTKNPDLLKASVLNTQNIAADILGLDVNQACQLFYCDYGSIWDRYAEEYQLSFDYDASETWQFHPKIAADIIRRLALGEIRFREPLEKM